MHDALLLQGTSVMVWMVVVMISEKNPTTQHPDFHQDKRCAVTDLDHDQLAK
jgi:hypothetical protein